MIIEKTDRYSDELLGFVIACLFCEAISRSEFQSWCLELLGLEETPSLLYDLIEFDEPAFKIYKVIGYVPNWRHSKNEEYALYGVALLRGTVPYDMPLSAAEMLGELTRLPAIQSMYRKVFPSIIF
ncbi:hypothetical protein [Pseudomonas lactis]|uniref:hypothetical protein n=1 Tax=Pseudomonas lactis TaxID=1615674 RepID=UPI0014741F9C|nr:hypothetical protein [Pseudomonas lactis]